MVSPPVNQISNKHSLAGTNRPFRNYRKAATLFLLYHHVRQTKMFDALVTQVVNHASLVGQRTDGVAFFRAAKDLYRLASITYFCANIPLPSPTKRYVHCVYSDTCIKQFISNDLVRLDFAKQDGLSSPPSALESADPPLYFSPGGYRINAEKDPALTVPLRERLGEMAVFGITVDMEPAEWSKQKHVVARECRILANYFHGHVLRISGCDSDDDILLSARELDCLKWTAAGKTAWEASIILGISERTVRFYLNTAREKLNCATTTQAVAKAVVNQLIDV
jgi:DNA-binding CsgD family transcriptional regulator